VVSICVGAFILGAAGALHGRKATTAWLFAEDLRTQVPAAEVVSDELVVTDSGVTTTAAFTAMYDFVVDLIERHHGATVARRTARIALVDDTRTSQSPYVDEKLLAPAGASFARTVQRHLERNLNLPYDLSRLAEHFHLSTRTLLRHYKAETGEAPLAHLQRARVRYAQHLLETTTWTLGDVQRTVGYRDTGAFTALFHRYTGLRPRDYRARFQPPRRVPDHQSNSRDSGCVG
jgi:transcriptional regulator GlxA family with amidase domain